MGPSSLSPILPRANARHVDVREAMLATRAVPTQRVLVLGGDVALARGELIHRETVVHGDHQSVTGHLGDHRGSSDAGRHPDPLSTRGVGTGRREPEIRR